MSIVIRCVYHGVAPAFPASDQHPDAVRYGPIQANGETIYVDALGGEPSVAALNSVLNPAPAVPAQISDRQFFQALAMADTISQAEALAAVKTGDIPAQMQAVIAGMAEADRFNAEMLLAGATVFVRANPMTEALRAAMGWSAEQTDELWRVAAEL